MIKFKTMSEWQGWLWIAITLFILLIGSGFGLYEKAEAYTDKQVTSLRVEIAQDVSDIKTDIRALRKDIMDCLREQ